jgi:hypothetical protein
LKVHSPAPYNDEQTLPELPDVVNFLTALAGMLPCLTPNRVSLSS